MAMSDAGIQTKRMSFSSIPFPPKRSALMTAAAGGNAEIIKILLGAKADVNAVDDFDRTALIWAAKVSQKEAVKALIDATADVDVKTKEGKTALDEAADYEIVRILLRAGKKDGENGGASSNPGKAGNIGNSGNSADSEKKESGKVIP